MARVKAGHLFSKLEASRVRERFCRLISREGVRLERIVSKGQSTPAGKWLKGMSDEWVIVLKGKAKLAFETKKSLILKPGGHVLIPAGMRHRVEWTPNRTATVWLALHMAKRGT